MFFASSTRRGVQAAVVLVAVVACASAPGANAQPRPLKYPSVSDGAGAVIDWIGPHRRQLAADFQFNSAKLGRYWEEWAAGGSGARTVCTFLHGKDQVYVMLIPGSPRSEKSVANRACASFIAHGWH